MPLRFYYLIPLMSGAMADIRVHAAFVAVALVQGQERSDLLAIYRKGATIRLATPAFPYAPAK